MKNSIIILLTALLLLATSLTSLADEAAPPTTRTYDLDEIGVSITLPLRYFVITTSTTQAELDANGLSDISAAEWVQSLYESDTYLEAVDFTDAAGGLFAQTTPNASPSSSVYVSFYPYEDIEDEFAYDGTVSRAEWLTRYYTSSPISSELAAVGITYTPDGKAEFAGHEWTKLNYSSAATLSDGIEYFLPLSDGELVVCIFSGNGNTLDASTLADFEQMMSSLTLDIPEPTDYTAIVTISTLLLSLGLLVFILAFKNK